MTEAEVVIDKLKESGMWIESPTLLEVSNFHNFLGINQLDFILLIFFF